MKSTIEKFKDIPGYKGLYQVSDYGCVRSLNYKGKKRIKYLRNNKTPKGYDRICLYRDGKRKMFSVHRIVWEAFNGEIPNDLQIDHINGVRDDNRLVNLRVVTPKENVNNPITRERHLEATLEANQRKTKDPKWREAQREGCKRRSKDPKWRKNHRVGMRKSHNKPVLQLDKETGEIIRKWECTADVERELGISNSHISGCCKKNRKSAGGFKWMFAE